VPDPRWEIARLNLADAHVGVGHGQRTATAVTGRAGVGPGTLRADPKTRPVERQDGAAPRGHRVDAHHRRAHAHAGHLRLELALELAGIVRHIGGRATHVEANHLLDSAKPGGTGHADNAAGRPAQDRIFAGKRLRVRQAA